jgi:hypothetical protein
VDLHVLNFTFLDYREKGEGSCRAGMSNMRPFASTPAAHTKDTVIWSFNSQNCSFYSLNWINVHRSQKKRDAFLYSECFFTLGNKIQPCTECTYLGIKIDQLGDNTIKIKHKISQTRQAINALNSIWWHKNITKNRKLHIYQTIIQSILMYGAELWQIPTRKINKILSTEVDVLRRSARKSRLEKINNENIKEIMGVEGKPDIIDIIEKKRLQWYGHVKRMPEERIPKLILEWVPADR